MVNYELFLMHICLYCQVDNCDVGYMLGMTANEDKVVAEATEELREKIATGTSSSEIEKELNTHNVYYNMKNKIDDWSRI
jgi:hypothetical protein